MRKPSFTSRGARAAALALAVAMAAVPAPAVAEGVKARPTEELQAQATLSASDFKLTYCYADPENPFGNELKSTEEPTLPYKGEEYVLDQDLQFDVQYLPDKDQYVEVVVNKPAANLASLGRKAFSLTVSVPYVEGLKEQTVTIPCAFTIEKVDIASKLVELWNEPPIYGFGATAEDIDWVPTLYYRDYLVKGTDFDVSLPAVVSEGVNQLTIVGKGNYTGSLTVDFTVGRNLADERADVMVIQHGDKHHPIFAKTEFERFLADPNDPLMGLSFLMDVRFDDEIVDMDDYTITMSEPDAQGEGVITVIAKEGASIRGQRSIPYTALFDKVDVSDAEVRLLYPSYVYTGSPNEPLVFELVKMIDGAELPISSFDIYQLCDDAVSYGNNTCVGTATVKVALENESYTGTATGTFEILDPAKLRTDGWELAGAITADSSMYDSSEVDGIIFDLVPGGETPLLDAYLHRESDGGEAYAFAPVVEVTNIRPDAELGAQGVMTCAVRIAGTDLMLDDAYRFVYDGMASLADATVTVKAQTYAGKALKPAPVVKLGGKTLKAGTDYTVAYANNTKAGTASLTVRGKGSYTGSKKVTFKISQAANTAKAAKTSVKKTVKAAAVKKKAQTVALPKVTAKFGKATWKVATKDAKKVLSLKGGKVVVKKGAKKGTYTIKLKASVAKTANYKAASTKVVVVKVTVK